MFRFGRNPFVYVSGAFGAIWVLVAWSRPENSYFLFPILVAASVPVSYRLIAGRALPVGFSAGAAVAGLFNVFLLAGLLAIAGKLDGPTLLPGANNVVDAVVLGAIGAVAGGFLTAYDFRSTKAGRR